MVCLFDPVNGNQMLLLPVVTLYGQKYEDTPGLNVSVRFWTIFLCKCIFPASLANKVIHLYGVHYLAYYLVSGNPYLLLHLC